MSTKCRQFLCALPAVFFTMMLFGCTVETGLSVEPAGGLPVVRTLPDFEFTDEDGHPFGLSDLRGKVWIGNFIFTRCPSTCPMQTAQMKRLQNRLQEHPRWDSIHLVSFTVDPDYDTAAVLKEYGAAAGAEPGRWKFLTSTRQAIWDLSTEAFSLAAGEPAQGDGPLFHSIKLVLLDTEGRIRGYYDGVSDEGVDALLQALADHEQVLFAASPAT